MTKQEIITMLTKILESMGIDGWVVELKSKALRSKNANAYSWVLQEKIANELKKSKDEVHVQMLTDYGQTLLDENGNKVIYAVESRIKFKSAYMYSAIAGYGKVGEKEFTHYRILKQSRDFDSDEMSIFLDGVIQEAKQLGIETITPKEREMMIQLWGEKKGE